MNQGADKKTEYKTCYIAFLDMLGFKSLINKNSCEAILNIFNKVRNPIHQVIYCDESGDLEISAIEKIKIKIISDSICFYVDAKEENALLALLLCCGTFQGDLLSLNPPVLTRGAITIGEIYAKGDITFGPGLTEAYLMEEKNAKYPRVILTNQTVNTAMSHTDECLKKDLLHLIYRDFDEFYTIDCFEPFEGFDTSGEKCKNLWLFIQLILDSTIDDSIREKYLYLKKALLRWYKPEDKANA